MLFGAISLIPEPCGSTYEALMRREHERRVMMLDPNIRPNFIPDKAKHLGRMQRDDGHGRHRQTVGRGPRLVRRSRLSMRTSSRNWLDRGPKLIVVTHGGEGAVGYTEEHKVTVMPQKVTVVDTVGAGDTVQRRHPRLAARAGPADQGGDRRPARGRDPARRWRSAPRPRR